MTRPTAMRSAEARVLRALSQLERELRPALPSGVPHLPAARARLSAGLPALLEEPLIVSADLQRALRTAARMIGLDPELSAARQAAEQLAEDSDLDSSLATPAVAGDWETIETLAVRAGLDPDASIVLADYAVRPWLRLAAAAVRPLVSASRWQSGHCPACGAPPLLAELRGSERERVLRCGRCASAWPFPRLLCVACGESRHERLGYLHAEGQEESRRADVCESCHGYLKAIASLDALSPEDLIEADLGSAALDFAALERGYHHATAPQG